MSHKVSEEGIDLFKEEQDQYNEKYRTLLTEIKGLSKGYSYSVHRLSHSDNSIENFSHIGLQIKLDLYQNSTRIFVEISN